MDKDLMIRNPNPYLKGLTPFNEDYEAQIFIERAKLPSVEALYVDTESNGQSLKDGRGHTIGISIDYAPDPLNAYSLYFPFRHKMGNLDHTYLSPIKDLIEKEGKTIVCHNIKHDLLAMESLGINCPFDFDDTMLLAHSVDENKLSYRLDYISKELGLPGKARDKYFDKAIQLLGWDGMPPVNMAPYAATDASLLRPIRDHYRPIYLKEDESNGENWKVDREFILLLNNIEKTGAKVDLTLAEKEIERGQERMDVITKELGLNPGSKEELKELLLGGLELPVLKRSAKTNKPSFDAKVMEQYEEMLQEINSPVAALVLEYRGYQKAVSTYWKAYLTHVSPDGRIRPNFNMHRTRTHRLSCDTPNLQNIPRVSEKPWHGQLKQGFIPEDDFELWEFDYAQLEFRLGAAYARQTDLIEIFNDPDRDIFTEMSFPLGMSRDHTKTLNYSLQYGAGIRRIMAAFGVSEAKAKSIRDNYFNNYSGFKAASNQAQQVCRSKGYVRTWATRRRHFPFPNQEAHKAFNAIIQGGAFEIVKRQMIRLYKEIGADNPECRMILQVHDSILFEIMKGKVEYYSRIIKRILEDVTPDFGVKFKVDAKIWGT